MPPVVAVALVSLAVMAVGAAVVVVAEVRQGFQALLDQADNALFEFSSDDEDS